MASNNTTTKKKFGGEREEVAQRALPTKDVGFGNRPGKYDGEMKSQAGGDFAEPMNRGAPAKITDLEGLHDDIGEQSGFITDGYLDKGGTPYGENAKFNFLPPGMDISNQENVEIHVMPMQKVTEESYPGDGWMPKPRTVV